jgi:hypothetical protein
VFFLAGAEPYARGEKATINKLLTIGNVRPNQNRSLMISKSDSESGSPSRLAQTATYWRYDPIYRSYFCARNSRYGGDYIGCDKPKPRT